MQENSELNKYIEVFKNKSLKEKQKEVINKLTSLTILTNKMCNELEIENSILYNRELDDLSNENYTQDDFVEAELVMLYSIENSLCDFSNKITDILEDLNS